MRYQNNLLWLLVSECPKCTQLGFAALAANLILDADVVPFLFSVFKYTTGTISKKCETTLLERKDQQ